MFKSIIYTTNCNSILEIFQYQIHSNHSKSNLGQKTWQGSFLQNEIEYADDIILTENVENVLEKENKYIQTEGQLEDHNIK